MKTFHYIHHILKFSNQENSLKPSDLSIYMAIFHCWGLNNFKNPISISKREIMKTSKISSTATYHKAIKKLNLFGFITYKPTFHPFKFSQIFINNPETKRPEKNEIL